MSLKLSERLQTVISMVTPGCIVADVGTDHGYVPMDLIERGIARQAIAMDVNEGPLSIAKMHIAQAGLSDKIETRLSDGVQGLKPGEADSVVIAGMGGMLIKRILEEGLETVRSLQELVLSPQSDLREVRLFLWENEIAIQREKLILEDGKYYWIFQCTPNLKDSLGDIPVNVFERFGKYLFETEDEVLYRFLLEQKAKYESILKQMEGRVMNAERMNANRDELNAITEGLRIFESNRNYQ